MSDDRNKRMGASDAAAALGLSPKLSPHSLWLEKTTPTERWEGNDATDAGKLFEGGLVDYAERELGALRRNVRVVSDRVPFPLAAQCDAILDATGEPVECKTTGLVGPVYGEWGEALTDQVPTHYLVQVSLQMFCTGAELAHLIALIGGRGIVQYQVKRSDDVINAIVDRLAEWWQRHIVEGIEPERSQPVPLDLLKRIRRAPNKVVALPETAIELLDKWIEAKEQAKLFKEAADGYQSDLIYLLGAAEGGTLPDGRALTYLETHRRGYEVQPCTYRTLRTPKPGTRIEQPKQLTKAADKKSLLADDATCAICGVALTTRTAKVTHFGDDQKPALVCGSCCIL